MHNTIGNLLPQLGHSCMDTGVFKGVKRLSARAGEHGALAAPAAPAVKPEDAVTARLLAWASAWSAKSADRYFEFYGEAFKPKTLTRETWRAQHTRRLATRDPIAVSLTEIQATATGPEQVETRFQQRYEAGTRIDQGEKVLLWQRVGGQWFIVSESGRQTGR